MQPAVNASSQQVLLTHGAVVASKVVVICRKTASHHIRCSLLLVDGLLQIWLAGPAAALSVSQLLLR
jgi:hypothetical protein